MSRSTVADQRGVTLIELMIVVIVVAILASIAVPSYRSYLLRAQRSDARAELLRVRSAQEKFFLQNNAYADDTAEMSAAPPDGLGIAAISEHGHYDLSLETPDPDRPTVLSFRATATAREGQTADSPCQTFTVNELGVRTAENGGGTDTTAQCWR